MKFSEGGRLFYSGAYSRAGDGALFRSEGSLEDGGILEVGDFFEVRDFFKVRDLLKGGRSFNDRAFLSMGYY